MYRVFAKFKYKIQPCIFKNKRDTLLNFGGLVVIRTIRRAKANFDIKYLRNGTLFIALFRSLCSLECAQSTELEIYSVSHLNFVNFGSLNAVMLLFWEFL